MHNIAALMAKIHVRGRIRRVGNSLALIIPSADARRARLRPGQEAAATIETTLPDPFGLMAHLKAGPFHREEEEHDRF